MKPNQRNARIVYAVLFVVILIVEILIALFVKDRFIRPYGGDFLVTVLLCCLLRIFDPQKHRLLPFWVFVFSAAIEIAQYFDVISLIGLDHIRFFRVLIGTSFSWIDLLCYAAGCAVFFMAEKFFKK